MISRGWKSKKRGLSQVVTTLMLVLLGVAAVVVVFGVIFNLIGSSSDRIEFGLNRADFNIRSAIYDDSSDPENEKIDVRVDRGTGDGNVVALSFVFEGSGNSEVIQKDSDLEELEGDLYAFDGSDFSEFESLGNVEKVSIAPVFESESGEERVGRVVDEEEVRTLSESQGETEDNDDSGDGNGNNNGGGGDNGGSSNLLQMNSFNVYNSEGIQVSEGNIINSDNDGLLLEVNATGDGSENKGNYTIYFDNEEGSTVDEITECGLMRGLYSCEITVGSYIGYQQTYIYSFSLNATVEDSNGDLVSEKIALKYNNYAYEDYITSLNPIAWWKLDGNADDRMDNYNGDAKNSITYPSGKIGEAASFDGSSNITTRLDLGNHLNTGGVTFVAWANPDNNDDFKGHIISSDPGGYGWSLLKQRDGDQWVVYMGGDFWETGSSVDVGSWQHLVVVYNLGESVEFYKNGSLVGINQYSPGTALDSKTYLGTNTLPDFPDSFEGDIDEVMVFEKSLSQEEIENIYSFG